MTVFHLSYRPRKIEDLDIVEVSEKIVKILSNKEVPQAFLFVGPKGSGKTSAARILARAINCEKPKGVEPCDKCKSCMAILDGSCIDVVEIDAASNRGIDDAKTLKDRAYFLPALLKKKVFVIDEVHMLTKEAFNALLKLIEEPPEHTFFVLCTTDADKIPETVLSRLMRIDFRKGRKEELKRSLAKVIRGEKITIDDEAVELIISKSDGSFRNLHRTFNEIFLQLGKKIGEKEVRNYFDNQQGDYSEGELEEDLWRGETALILRKLEDLANRGISFSELRERWLGFFQRRLLVESGLGSDKERGKLRIEEIRRWLSLLIAAGKLEKEAFIDQLPLELAVVEFIESSKIKNQISKLEEKIGGEEQKKEKEVEKKAEVAVSGLGIEEIEEKWNHFLTVVRPFNHSVEAFLRATRPKLLKGNTIVIEVYYPFHKERLEETRNRRLVEEGLNKVFGIDLGFECVLGKSKKQPILIDNDTPVEKVSQELVPEEKKDIYDVAKEIFG